MSYNKALIEIIIFLIFVSFSLPIVSGDAEFLGWNYDNVEMIPFNNTTNVQMINETVYIDLYEEKAVVDCNFTFKNWGEREQMIVGFPIESRYEPLNDFEVYVDLQPVERRLTDNYTEFDEMCDWNYRADAWYIWNMTFEKTETKYVKVRYWSGVSSQNNAFNFQPKIWVMDSDGSNKRLLNTIETWDSSGVWSPDGSKIAFVAGPEKGLYKGSNYGPCDGGNIWIMNRDGSGKRQLTTKETYDYSPQWSPDGSKILFVSEPSGNEEIYEACKSIWVMNSDGSDKKQLTAFETNDLLPSWSPDGSKIAYVSSNYTVKTISDLYQTTNVFSPRFTVQSNRCIWVMDSDGSDKTQLTSTFESCGHPVWSPDGSKIAVISGSGGWYPSDLFVMNSDGTNLKSLTAIENTEHIMSKSQGISAFKRYFLAPAWSPDGTKVLFLSNESIFVINSNGSHKMQLTTNETCAKSPAWNPGGSQIAYTYGEYEDDEWSSIWGQRGIASNGQIWMMDSDGTNKRQLTANEVEKLRYSYSDLTPVWNPDGGRILFESGHGGICVINRDGTETKRLTEDVTCSISSCTWSPDGTKMVFVSDRWDSPNIWVMNSDGSNKKKITTGSQPVRSPEGDKIAFTSGGSENRSIWIMNDDGSDKHELTTGYEPEWSPEGNKIAFTSRGSENRSIWVMNDDGCDKHELITGYEPIWSPEGDKIAFTSGGSENRSIWVMNDDGSDKHELTTGYEPEWSPEGDKIAFTTGRFDKRSIRVIDCDGKNEKQLAANLTLDGIIWNTCFHPKWNPDGSKIAFTSEWNSYVLPYYQPSYTLWVADSDGSNPTQLTTNEIGVAGGNEWSLSWSPDGSKIAFVASPSNANYHRFEYILTTGATWKDTIGEADIIIRLHDINDKDVTWISPQGYVFKDNAVSWHFSSLEPTENIELGFVTHHPISAEPYTETEESPGFEVICVLVVLVTAAFLKRILI